MEAATGPGWPRRRLGRRSGFWVLAASLLAVMAAAGAPSPLYAVYQQRWGFSTGVLTLVFAVYALTLLAALLTVGGLSDHIGRRPVVVVALVVAAASMGMFLLANGPGRLVAARAVQGVSTGVATGALAAGLIELQPERSNGLGAVLGSIGTPAGVAIGGLAAGLVLQFLPAPTTVVFTGFAVLFLVLAVAAVGLPETSPRRRGAVASLRPRIGVPREARTTFARSAAATVVAWSLVGLFLSLGPSLATESLHLRGGLAGGVVVAAFTGPGAVAGLLLRGRTPQVIMPAGLFTLAVGITLAAGALAGGSAWLFFVGTTLAGVGFGAAFFGAFGALASIRTARRAELTSAFYIASYLAMSLPSMLAGVLVPAFGLSIVVVGYAGFVAIVAVAVGASSITRGRVLGSRPVDDGRDITP